MKYVSKVKSSIKGGCDVQLSPRTVIVGPNGAGKTTVVQTMELASSGWVSDMEGRDRVKQSKALSRLFPDPKSMYAHIEVTDTETETQAEFDWSMKAGPRGGFKTPEHEPPFRLTFPVQDLIATLRGDASTVGAWLEQQVLDTMSVDDLLSALPPAVRDDAEKFIRHQRSSDFLALSKEAAKESKNLKTQATRTEKTIDKMVEGIAPPLTQGKREDLQEQLEKLSQRSTKGVKQEEYDVLEKQVLQLDNDIAALRAKLAGLTAPPDAALAALDKVNGAKHLIRMHMEMFGLDSCWLCGNDDAEAIAKQVDTLVGIEGELREHKEAADLLRGGKQLIQQYEAELQSKKQWLAGLHVSDGTEEAEMRQLLEALSQDKANRRAWENAEAERKEIGQMRARADRLSLIGKELKKAGQYLLNQRKAAFEEKVSSFLPGDEQFGVDLATARIGLVRDGQLHSALSGAEESRVQLALASAQEDGTTPCVLIPRDRAWDEKTLTSVMEALADSPVQVVIMSTVEPAPVEGWTLVQL